MFFIFLWKVATNMGLDLIITSRKLCVSYPTSNGCGEKYAHLPPAYLTFVRSFVHLFVRSFVIECKSRIVMHTICYLVTSHESCTYCSPREAPEVPLSYGPNVGGLALGGALREADLTAKPCKRKK